MATFELASPTVSFVKLWLGHSSVTPTNFVISLVYLHKHIQFFVEQMCERHSNLLTDKIKDLKLMSDVKGPQYQNNSKIPHTTFYSLSIVML